MPKKRDISGKKYKGKKGTTHQAKSIQKKQGKKVIKVTEHRRSRPTIKSSKEKVPRANTIRDVEHSINPSSPWPRPGNKEED